LMTFPCPITLELWLPGVWFCKGIGAGRGGCGLLLRQRFVTIQSVTARITATMGEMMAAISAPVDRPSEDFVEGVEGVEDEG
jgi:hypothetical protein